MKLHPAPFSFNLRMMKTFHFHSLFFTLWNFHFKFLLLSIWPPHFLNFWKFITVVALLLCCCDKLLFFKFILLSFHKRIFFYCFCFIIDLYRVKFSIWRECYGNGLSHDKCFLTFVGLIIFLIIYILIPGV